MTVELYIDEVFLTNLVMDYLILRLLVRILRCRCSRARSLAGAFAGALGACLILVIPTDSLPAGKLLLHLLLAIVMVRLGCDIRTKEMLLRAVPALYFTAFLCGGFWDVLTAGGSMTLKTFLLSAVSTYGLLTLGSMLRDCVKARTENVCRVHLSCGGKVLRVRGLLDTGNLLVDPATRKPVSILSGDSLEELLGRELTGALKAYQGTKEETDWCEWRSLKPHFLTFQSVGNSSGMVLAVTLDEMCIHRAGNVLWVHRPVVAVPGEDILPKDYKIILNANLTGS